MEQMIERVRKLIPISQIDVSFDTDDETIRLHLLRLIRKCITEKSAKNNALLQRLGRHRAFVQVYKQCTTIKTSQIRDDLLKELMLREKTFALESIDVDYENESLGNRFAAASSSEQLQSVLTRICLKDSLLIRNRANNQPEFSRFARYEPFESNALCQTAIDALVMGLDTVSAPCIPTVERCAEILLHFECAPTLVLMLIANYPNSIRRIALNLVDSMPADVGDNPTPFDKHRMTVLQSLLCVDPSIVEDIVQSCRQQNKAPQFLLSLLQTERFYPDRVSALNVLSNLLIQSIQNSPNSKFPKGSIAQLISSSGKLSAKKQMHQRAIVEFFIQALDQLIPDGRNSLDVVTRKDITDAIIAIQCLIAISVVCPTIYVTQPESMKLRYLVCVQLSTSINITKDPQLESHYHRLIQLCLCALVVSSRQLLSTVSPGSSNSDVERFSMWLSAIVRDGRQAQTATMASRSNYLETLVTISLHMHADNMTTQTGTSSHLTTLISDIVGHQCGAAFLQVPSPCVRQLLTTTPLHMQNLRNLAVCLNVTPNLSAAVDSSSSKTLPLHSVILFLNTINIIDQTTKGSDLIHMADRFSNWVADQIESTTIPVHADCVQLIDSLVAVRESCAQLSNHSLISSDRIKKILRTGQNEAAPFNVTDRALVPRVLVVYYLLRCRHSYYRQCERTAEQGDLVTPTIHYSVKLLNIVPAAFMMTQMLEKYDNFSNLIPYFSELIVSPHHRPRLKLPDQNHRMAMTDRGSTETTISSDKNDVKSLCRCLNALAVCDYETTLLSMPSTLPTCIEVLRSKDGTSLALQSAIASYVERLEQMMPSHVYLHSMKSLLNLPGLTRSKLIQNPLLILTCDDIVFERACLAEIMLKALDFFLLESRESIMCRAAHTKLNVPSINGDRDKALMERQAARNYYIGTQESAALQLLFEKLAFENNTTSATDNTDPSEDEIIDRLAFEKEREAAHRIIYRYIHKMFQSTPDNEKLVHYQTFSPSILSSMAKEVPTLHQTIDYLDELLLVGPMKRRIFAFHTIAALATHQCTPRVVGLARLSVAVLNACVSSLNAQQSSTMFVEVAEAIEAIVLAVPPLYGSVAQILATLQVKCLEAMQSNEVNDKAPIQAMNKIDFLIHSMALKTC